MTKLYRYSNNINDSLDIISVYEYNLAQVYLHEFEVDKNTTCGSWIVHAYGKRRFINHTKQKQYAYKTIEEAKLNFLARKQMQIKILKFQLNIAKDSMIAMETEPRTYETHYYFTENIEV